MSTLSLNERRELIDWQEKALNIKDQASLLRLNRTGLYYRPTVPTEEELRLRSEVDRLNTDHPSYGSRMIASTLRNAGWTISRKKVRHLMREMGLEAIYPERKTNLSANATEERRFPYLLRGIEALCPDHIWGTDIAYVRLKGGWMYLTVILDWYSRYVVSWSLSDTLASDFVLDTLNRELRRGHPKIINSDQGVQYTSAACMDGRGRCMDNIFTERFWRTYKYEEVYLKDYESPRVCRRETARYLEHYNTSRPHSALKGKTPAEAYADKGKSSLFIT